MGTYRHMRTGRVVTESEYRRMLYSEQKEYSYQSSATASDNSGDFLMSAALGALTDNTVIGGLLGGDIVGGLAGDLLSDGEFF